MYGSMIPPNSIIVLTRDLCLHIVHSLVKMTSILIALRTTLSYQRGNARHLNLEPSGNGIPTFHLFLTEWKTNPGEPRGQNGENKNSFKVSIVSLVLSLGHCFRMNICHGSLDKKIGNAAEAFLKENLKVKSLEIVAFLVLPTLQLPANASIA